MRVLLTGASGFIGQAVLSKLLERGHCITAVYNRSPIQNITGSPSTKSFANFSALKLDLLNEDELHNYIMGHDWVIHLAYNFQGSIQDQFTFAKKTTQSLLAACARVKVKKLVYASTIAVYADPPKSGLITEDSPRLASIRPYGLSKQATEKFLLESDAGDTELVVIQPSIVYGPGRNGWTSGVLTQMQNFLLPLIQKGSGYCNPVYVDDVAQAIIQACETPNLHKNCFIITNDEPISWLRFFTYYESILETKSLIDLPHYVYKHQNHVPRHRRGVRKGINKIAEKLYGKPIQYPSLEEIHFFSAQPVFSNQKARKFLNFQPSISIEVGMERVKEWWHQQRLETK